MSVSQERHARQRSWYLGIFENCEVVSCDYPTKGLAYPRCQGRNMHRISELLGVEDSRLLYVSNSSGLSPMNPMRDVRQTWSAYLI